MGAIWFNRAIDDEERRKALYSGDIFVYDHLPTVERFATFARKLVEEALTPHEPRKIHEVLTPAELAPLLGRLKPAFTHHPEVASHLRQIVEELGCDLNDCYIDVARLRTAYPSGHLTKGIAFAFAPHRDTWYAAPAAQLNWWLPLYPLTRDNAMSFHPRYFSRPVPNNSEDFNYYRRNAERTSVVEFIDHDPRVQPSALELGADEAEFRLLPAVGGLILFSGTQMHATTAGADSLSRYSVDFRTVSRSDVENGLGAPNVDSRCVGTALRDFRRGSDRAAIPESLAVKLDPRPVAEGEVAVFKPA